MNIASIASSAVSMLFGGGPMKAVLSVDPSDSRASELKGVELAFQFNPEHITINRASNFDSLPTHGTEGGVGTQQAGSSNRAPAGAGGGLGTNTMTLSNVIFDTYEWKPILSVYKLYIEKLEKFVFNDKHKHAPAKLIFTWGLFTGERSYQHQLKCLLDTLKVDYTLFLPTGMPVRAKVDLNFKIGLASDEQADQHGFQSPDHAKLVQVKRGDTLADIAYVEYDNPAEWRRIADANGIDDPMSLRPGMTLIVPPILS